MNGIVPLYKPKGNTSGACVYRLRHLLQEKKIGHTGTLDPDVDGVLVLCVGQATKLVNRLMDSHKIYQGQVTLGVATTTEDASGEVIACKPLAQPFDKQVIQAAMQQLTGTIDQTPPLYSAVKVKGRRLYEYARLHEPVERPTRRVTIYNFQMLADPFFNTATQQQTINFTVECSKGTYIRTLAVQLGELLQVPAHMSALTRSYGSGFGLAQTFSFTDIETQLAQGRRDFLLPLDFAIPQMSHYELSPLQWQLVQNGHWLTLPEQTAPELALYYHRVLKAIYQRQTQRFVPQLMLLNNDR